MQDNINQPPHDPRQRWYNSQITKMLNPPQNESADRSMAALAFATTLNEKLLSKALKDGESVATRITEMQLPKAPETEESPE